MGGPPRGSLNEEELRKARAQDKYNRVMRQLGHTATVDAAPAIAHARMLHAKGMAGRQIAERAGLGPTTLGQVIRGSRDISKGLRPITTLPRTTVEAILSVSYDEVEEGTAILPATGTVRRLQALVADGFSGNFLAEAMGLGSNSRVWQVMENDQVTARMEHRTRAVYAKYEGTDPADLGLSGYSIGRAKGTAARHGFAPSHCWDADTIEDPAAIPEWTGLCGTWQGYNLHRKQHIPYCAPCRKAMNAHVR